MLNHVVTSQVGLLSRAGLDVPPGPTADDDPAAAWAHTKDAIQRILDDPDRAGTEYEGMGGSTTVADTFDRFMCLDLVVHRWDIANATGGDEHIPAGDRAAVRAFADRMGDMMRTSGAFGPEVPAPQGADEQARLLAFLGRQSI